MGPRRIVVALAAACLAVLPSSAAAGSDAGTRLLYTASESGRFAVDRSTFGNDAVLRGGVDRAKGAYRFRPGYPHDRIKAAHHSSLNPGRRAFSYGVEVRVPANAAWAHDEMSVLRHGDSETPSGDYKLQLVQTDRGTVSAVCAMHDGRGGSGYVRGSVGLDTIDDGRWHTITCARQPTDRTVSLTIDGQTRTRPATLSGSIIGDQPLLLGVQPRNTRRGFREQFVGRMDDIHIAVHE